MTKLLLLWPAFFLRAGYRWQCDARGEGLKENGANLMNGSENTGDACARCISWFEGFSVMTT